MVRDPAFRRDVQDNPLRGRRDLQRLVVALWRPLRTAYASGGAALRFGATGAHFSLRDAELEGFARPLWGLVPLLAGGGELDVAALVRKRLAHGTDPMSEEYWGAPSKYAHCFVEMVPIAMGLALTPERLWQPLPARVRRNLVQWLSEINRFPLYVNNWQLFRPLVNLGLKAVGVPIGAEANEEALDAIESMYARDGWYRDGLNGHYDYYGAFTFHYYCLLYSRLAAKEDPKRAAMFRKRAAEFARRFADLFDADGAAIPFGRSLTYRFAQGALWGALAFAGVPAMSWGVIKGLYLRHLRWWFRRPIFNADGTLSIGYAYPNLNIAEDYNAGPSPYWAFKAFWALAVPARHPFWTAPEESLPPRPRVRAHVPGWIVCADAGRKHVFLLNAGAPRSTVRHGAAKYGKLAYSSEFGFSVPAGDVGLRQAGLDSMLGLSDGADHFRVRNECLERRVCSRQAYSVWMPWPDVEVRTWLVPLLPWHVRVHRVATERPLRSCEGGFAVPRDDPGETVLMSSDAVAVFSVGLSTGIRDLMGGRKAALLRPSPNTNVIHARTLLPALEVSLSAGVHWLACAVVGHRGAMNPRTWRTHPTVEIAREVTVAFRRHRVILSESGAALGAAHVAPNT